MADVRQMGRGAPGDDAARFLRELRQLRDGAGLGQAELAARAHYPYDTIRAAEVGPTLPDLPVLSAYVRGCGGTTEEWEERWRSLTRTPSLPVSGARQSGSSEAASAGARIGSSTPVGDGPDPSIIIAALGRVAEEMASPGDDAAAAAVPPVPDFPPVPDYPPSEALPARSTATPPPPARSGSAWDPIRVSSAWPAIPNTPASADGSVGNAGKPDAAAPWEAAPWGENPLEPTAPAARADGTASGTHPAGDAPRAAGRSAAGTRASGRTARTSGRAPARAGRSVNSSSRTTMVVLVVILLCVLAVLLAIFA
jgi:hypothetical protein